MKNARILIIPDVHGRSFWRTAVDKALKSDIIPEIVFLGDYVDPYPLEGISPGEAINGLFEILSIKKKNPDKVHLLLGNHDMGYLDSYINTCRRDEEHEALLHRLFSVNLPLFDLAWETRVSGKRFLFTHAGVNRRWLLGNEFFFEGKEDITASFLNGALHSNSQQSSRYEELLSILSDASFLRGGSTTYGSVIWADVAEFLIDDNCLKDTIQVFGHTQQLEAPLCLGEKGNPNTYCLDCREPFILDAEGNIRHYSTGEIVGL